MLLFSSLSIEACSHTIFFSKLFLGSCATSVMKTLYAGVMRHRIGDLMSCIT